jgi:hypothetical protein
MIVVLLYDEYEGLNITISAIGLRHQKCVIDYMITVGGQKMSSSILIIDIDGL